MSAPVAALTAALSPMWSQWRWVETMSLSVQPRSASWPVSQATHGVAVSMAIASRLASSPRIQTLVATGPTTRCRISIVVSRAARARGSGTGLPSAVARRTKTPSTRMLARASR